MPTPYGSGMPIRVRGRDFKNQHHACAELNIREGTLYTHLCKGTIDSAGIGPGKHPNSRNGGGKHRRPVKVGPYTFASQQAVDRYVGMRKGYTSTVLRRKRAGQIGPWQGLVRRVMEKKAEEERADHG